VSRFQERILWKRVATTNVRFAFVQASRGSGGDCAVVPSECGPDGWYAGNYRRARANGIRVGAYHRAFADGATRRQAAADARMEARVFLREVGRLRRGDLRPALDLETPFGELDAPRLRLWIRTWLERVEEQLGVKPIIYTNHSSWQATGDTRRFARLGHPLWVAQWEVRSPLVPADDWAGLGWRVWQFTSSGKVRGIKGRVDRNRLVGGFRGIAVRR
jgi:lysozyme